MKFYFKHLLCCLSVLFFYGCYDETTIAHLEPNQKVTKVITTDGKELDFSDDELGYALVKENTLVRFLNNGSFEEIPLSNIKTAYFKEELSSYPTVYAISLVATGLLLSYFLLVKSFGI